MSTTFGVVEIMLASPSWRSAWIKMGLELVMVALLSKIMNNKRQGKGCLIPVLTAGYRQRTQTGFKKRIPAAFCRNPEEKYRIPSAIELLRVFWIREEIVEQSQKLRHLFLENQVMETARQREPEASLASVEQTLPLTVFLVRSHENEVSGGENSYETGSKNRGF